ncbi:aminopeptidase [Pedobacter yulinensis]|uniref:Aminopeptidase n=1 Tax=Pedobacter yulinensis TaxID=2126353 RepID=A0A2T3HR39_9SPHI|nr:M28 family peptidase [Pedobacter yulinensis]PST84930.1 aminopeptidase [Pedobacter yulinensis]
MFAACRLALFAFLLPVLPAAAQDRAFTEANLKQLSSAAFWGRGYTRDGMKKAAGFLALQLKTAGLKALNGDSYLQEFTYPVNTFPGKMHLTLNGQSLRPGVDFLVGNESIGQRLNNEALSKKDSITYVSATTKTVFIFQDKLTWSVAREVAPYTVIYLNRQTVKGEPQRFSMDIENRFVPAFQAYNVCGMVRGRSKPDSLLVLTAHYDHLGGMGDRTWFPGANDNASGVSTLLSLARHYARNVPDYSVVFVFFAGEEAGLLGSEFFTARPLVPLSSIRFLLNLDLVGTGEEGATVVNASLYPRAFEQLEQVNSAGGFLPRLARRGKAANSDHFHFSEKGVPAFFMYTMGGVKAYHDVNDKAETLPMTHYEGVFKLITGFFDRQMGK